MIYNVLSSAIAPGKNKAAEQWLLKFTAYINQRFPGTNAQILRNINGPQNRVHYVESFDSLGALEATDKALATEAEWLALLGEADGLFVPGSTERNLYQVLA